MATKRPKVEIEKDLNDARIQLVNIEKVITSFSESPQEFAFELSKAGKDRETTKAAIAGLEVELKA